jgi:hypothetical protein
VPRARSAGSLQIKASGRVVRVEDSQRSKRTGFAVFGDMRLFSEDSVPDWLVRSYRVDGI